MVDEQAEWDRRGELIDALRYERDRLQTANGDLARALELYRGVEAERDRLCGALRRIYHADSQLSPSEDYVAFVRRVAREQIELLDRAALAETEGADAAPVSTTCCTSHYGHPHG